jgi:predicted nucleic acid-binding Zn ribbon protein
MNEQHNKCLFCQGKNDINNSHCEHCGMALPKNHPQDKRSKISFFDKAFWAIVIFCIIMMFYLPR